MSDKKLSTIQNEDNAEFYQQVADLLIAARKHAKKQVDTTIAVTYFEIGRMIFDREQQGQKRAQYGKKLIEGLSDYLTDKIGKGFSVVNLKNMRKFYQVYSLSIGQTLSAQLEKSPKQQLSPANSELENHYALSSVFAHGEKRQTLSALFKLGWSHYQTLMRLENVDARSFYEIEAANQQWSVRELQRQVGSSLYERLALSRDKDGVMALAKEGQVLETSQDIFKDSYIFEFTGLEERSKYSESQLEQALIDNMQRFLLELGKGFLLEARQKRFTFDEDSFYVDLVLYNRLLQCYVIIDLKIGKLKHQDLGQMQMYVNYFDRFVKKDFEKPTVGILICEDSKKNIVELTLPQDANIYASEYSLYLPDKSLLQSKLAQWIKEFEDEQEENRSDEQ
ncbi:MAG: PDDEXK nuclease domain-containing protein [Oscillospiraceae bacterium]|nr:PDDEXK nuclease domain-containing protein [Oscillospiraceae bacterium]